MISNVSKSFDSSLGGQYASNSSESSNSSLPSFVDVSSNGKGIQTPSEQSCLLFDYKQVFTR